MAAWRRLVCAAWVWAKCRREEGGLIVPQLSRHARGNKTRRAGRAHLLWEMTQGEVIPGWLAQRRVKAIA